MPKMKTHRGARKRFKRTGSGKWKMKRSNRSHLLTKKSMDRKRRLRRAGFVDRSDAGRLKRLFPGT